MQGICFHELWCSDRISLEEMIFMRICMKDTCGDCSHNKEGYCDIYEKDVKSTSGACPEFEEV